MRMSRLFCASLCARCARVRRHSHVYAHVDANSCARTCVLIERSCAHIPCTCARVHSHLRTMMSSGRGRVLPSWLLVPDSPRGPSDLILRSGRSREGPGGW
eukprot:15469432-Alexandrium_andersonii.AAC.1